MAKTYTVPEMRLKLASDIRAKIIKFADGIADLKKREEFKTELRKNNLLQDAHPEPGTHEPAQVGVPQHLEAGDHEQFELNGPQPDAGTAEPIVGGSGVAPGQLDPQSAPGQSTAMAPMHMDQPTPPANPDDMCPLCGNVDQPGSCTCLQGMMKGELTKNALMGYPGGTGMGGSGAAQGGATGGPAPMTPASPAMGAGATAGAPAGIGAQGGNAMMMAEAKANGETNDPSKKQPFKKQPDAKLPPEDGGKKLPSPGSGNDKPKAMAKMTVPEAKPPSGKVPGSSVQPPVASNTSKPGVTKAELDKSLLPPGAGEGKMGGQGGDGTHRAPDFSHAGNTAVKGYNAPPHPEPEAPKESGGHAPPEDFAQQSKQHWIHALTAHMNAKRSMGKSEPMAKAIQVPGQKQQMQQHGAIDASKQAAGAVAPAPTMAPKPLTHPADMGRANAHAAALGGAFQPKAPVQSGLQLAPPKTHALGVPAPAGLKPGFLKNERCGFCGSAEHAGPCKK